ncbi:unnamed protein product [Ilex paraguariensis]|uniref:Disease resistance N-terminal domain-containing protein n=1 Tax=Ilex paraguariensis TaxID=185542 RepID=A0ABC8R0J7_9AQUA
MAGTAVDFLLEDLKQLLNHSSDWFQAEKDEIETLYEELKYIRAFLSDLESCNEQEELKNLVTHIRDVACKALTYLDFFALQVVTRKYESMAGKIGYAFNNCLNLRNFREEIKSIKKDVMEVYDKKLYGIGVPLVEISSTESFFRASTPSSAEEEIVVGFDEDTATIVERLVGDQKQLDIISVVGMGGLDWWRKLRGNFVKGSQQHAWALLRYRTYSSPLQILVIISDDFGSVGWSFPFYYRLNLKRLMFRGITIWSRKYYFRIIF